MVNPGKIKSMAYLVDTCGKELAECLDRATADGNIFQAKCIFIFHCEINVWKLWKIQEYVYIYTYFIHIYAYICVCVMIYCAVSAYPVLRFFIAHCYWNK